MTRSVHALHLHCHWGTFLAGKLPDGIRHNLATSVVSFSCSEIRIRMNPIDFDGGSKRLSPTPFLYSGERESAWVWWSYPDAPEAPKRSQ